MNFLSSILTKLLGGILGGVSGGASWLLQIFLDYIGKKLWIAGKKMVDTIIRNVKRKAKSDAAIKKHEDGIENHAPREERQKNEEDVLNSVDE